MVQPHRRPAGEAAATTAPADTPASESQRSLPSLPRRADQAGGHRRALRRHSRGGHRRLQALAPDAPDQVAHDGFFFGVDQ